MEDNPIRRVLRRGLCSTAVALRHVIPSSNASIKLVTNGRTQPQVVLDFSSSRGENAIKWYLDQLGKSVRFTLLEYRKTKGGIIQHEFIVVQLDNNTVCRFDRRADLNTPAQAIRDQGTLAEDSAQIIDRDSKLYRDMINQSERILQMEFPGGKDLGLILEICRGIQMHQQAVAYSLLQFNCYFFSWTIITAVARQDFKWERVADSQEIWDNIILSSVGSITSLQPDPLPALPKDSKQIPERSLRVILGRAPKVTQMANPDDQWGFRFREILVLQLQEYRPHVFRLLRGLLLRSQLIPFLRRDITEGSKRAFREARDLISEESAVITSMDHASSIEPIQDGTWVDHCDVAWQVVVAASRAAAAKAKEPQGDDGSSQTHRDDKYWEKEWDSAWEKEWLETASSYTHLNSSNQIGEAASVRAKFAWGKAWATSTELYNRHVEEVAKSTAGILVDKLVDFDPKTTTFEKEVGRPGTRGSKQAPQSLQQFIRNRMQNHFEMVDKYGFGTFMELLDCAEKSMCEIWETVVNRDLQNVEFPWPLAVPA
ncbi:hypothetical protein OPQ81_002212 [Rhizoctonia solani]|nr:hypothetical protein OPQ81_002212 [Rhizoctonia solani]